MGLHLVFFCGRQPAKNTPYFHPPQDFPKTRDAGELHQKSVDLYEHTLQDFHLIIKTSPPVSSRKI
jgi:hypothetical protein